VILVRGKLSDIPRPMPTFGKAAAHGAATGA